MEFRFGRSILTLNDIIQTRLIRWKKDWLNVLFWLSFPIIAPLVIVSAMNAIQEDTKIPVGIVLEENTPFATGIYEAIKGTPFIRGYALNETDAIDKLNKHELDSVFVIQKGYERNIRKGSRNQLVKGYQSDLSFAYTPVSEMVISYVQQDSGRSKAAHVVRQLSEQYDAKEQWTWDEIYEKSIAIQKEQHLLNNTFSFANTDKTEDKQEGNLISTWGLWALFSLLSTLLLFDWLIKENRKNIMPRFYFMRMTFKKYLVLNLCLYTIILLIFDTIALLTFNYYLNEAISITLFGAIFFYRIMITIGAFLLGISFRNSYLFYSFSFALTLFLAISSGAIIPIEGLTNRMPWMEYINPLHTFLSNRFFNIWFFVLMLLFIIWYGRKEDKNASCQLLNKKI